MISGRGATWGTFAPRPLTAGSGSADRIQLSAHPSWESAETPIRCRLAPAGSGLITNAARNSPPAVRRIAADDVGPISLPLADLVVGRAYPSPDNRRVSNSQPCLALAHTASKQFARHLAGPTARQSRTNRSLAHECGREEPDRCAVSHG